MIQFNDDTFGNIRRNHFHRRAIEHSRAAGPFKPGCQGSIVGCNRNTWTPGNHNHWNGGYGGFSGGLSINLAQPAAMDEGDCYYVRRQVFIPQVGLVSKRQLVCN